MHCCIAVGLICSYYFLNIAGPLPCIKSSCKSIRFMCNCPVRNDEKKACSFLNLQQPWGRERKVHANYLFKDFKRACKDEKTFCLAEHYGLSLFGFAVLLKALIRSEEDFKLKRRLYRALNKKVWNQWFQVLQKICGVL